MGNLLPTTQPFWFHLSFYSSLYKLINRRVWIKKVSFFIFCIAGALSAFHTAAIKHPGALGSLFSFWRPKQTPSYPLQMRLPFCLAPATAAKRRSWCHLPSGLNLHLRVYAQTCSVTLFLGPSQAGEAAASVSIFQHPSAPCLISTAWLGWWMGPASLRSDGVQTGCAMHFICFKDSCEAQAKL